VSEQSVPTNVAVAETFEKLAQAMIAHAAALTSFAGLYRGGAPAAPAATDPAAPAPAKAARGGKAKGPEAPATAAPTLKEVQDFAVAWIKEGASDAAQVAIKSQVVAITNKYGAQKIAELPTTALAAVLGELQAAKAGGAGAPTGAIDI
jgi:hypothetical protein